MTFSRVSRQRTSFALSPLLALFAGIVASGCGGGSGGHTYAPSDPAHQVAYRTVALSGGKDLVYRPADGKLYVSLPGTDSDPGNSLAEIDPASGTVEKNIIVGSKPNRLALTDDQQYLYVGVDGESAVRRVNIASGEADQRMELGVDPMYGAFVAGDIAVAPGHPDWVAVVCKAHVIPSTRDTVLFVNGTKAAISTSTTVTSDYIVFGSDSTRMYGYDSGTGSVDLYSFRVDVNGISKLGIFPDVINGWTDPDFPDIFTGLEERIQFADGYIYATTGQVVDPQTMTMVKKIPTAGAICIDKARNRLYTINAIDKEVYDNGIKGYLEYTITSYDATTLTVINHELIARPAIALFDSGAYSERHGVARFVRWGSDGLAFLTTDGFVILVDKTPA